MILTKLPASTGAMDTEYLENILGGLITGAAVIFKGRILYANASFCAMLGKEPLEVLGADPVEWFHPEDRLSFRATLKRRAEGMRPRGTHLYRMSLGPGKTLQVEVEASPLQRRGMILILARDVSQKIRLEERLRQVQKMEALGQLAAGVAHDFNNLLGAMANYLTIMRAHVGSGTEAMTLLSEMQGLIERGSDLVRQILVASKMEGEKEPSTEDLNRVIRPIIRILRHTLPKRIRVVFEEGGVPPIRMDPSQIQQVVMNLCMNAADAMPRGGEIKIDTCLVELTRAMTQGIPGVEPGRYARITVSDTGLGMTQEVRERIFEPFFTTKDNAERTGLGLSICYAIVRRHGGFIEVESTPGAGSEFKVYLPFVEGAVHTLTPEPDGRIPKGSETILLVEDEEAMRSSTRRLLEEMGYTVVAASSGVEALEVLSAGEERIDMVLLDLGMPGMDGLETLRRMKDLKAVVKAVIMTGLPHSPEAKEALKEGAVGVLQKPFSLAQLAQILRDALD